MLSGPAVGDRRFIVRCAALTVLTLLAVSCHAPLQIRPEALPEVVEVAPGEALQALKCPLPPRPSVPDKPELLSVMNLASLASQSCFQRCENDETLTVALRVGISGAIEAFAVIEPQHECLRAKEVIECVGRVFEQLCFEPTLEGIAHMKAMTPALGGTATRAHASVPVYVGRGPHPELRVAPSGLGARGSARLHFDIDPDGRVQNARVVEIEGDKAVGSRALSAV